MLLETGSLLNINSGISWVAPGEKSWWLTQGFLRKGPGNRSPALSPKQKYQTLPHYTKVLLHATPPPFGYPSQGLKAGSWRDFCTRMFTTALSQHHVLEVSQKSISRWADEENVAYIYIYSRILCSPQKKKILLHGTTWMKLKHVNAKHHKIMYASTCMQFLK